MTDFMRFNRKNIDDRRIDTLVGLSKGIVADGVVNQAEAEFLLTWLIQNEGTSHPIILNLLGRLAEMLEDGNLDAAEAAELLHILRCFCGPASEIGELAKPSKLPITQPAPRILFEGSLFLLTGTFAFGSRNACHAAIEQLGGRVSTSVTQSLDYLVLGSYVTDSWAHETFGRKIEKALEYRDAGHPIVIVTEEHWAVEGRL